MTSMCLAMVALVSAWTAAAGPSDVPRVDNPARAPRSEVVRLEELWRVGEDDQEIVFGRISGILVDGDGRVYVADSQAHEISVFSREGEFLRFLGREGEGPGEFREPRSLVLMPDGKVGVVHEQPPRIVCFRVSDGEFVEDFHFTEDPKHPFQRLSWVACRGKTLVAYAADISQNADGIRATGRLMRFDAAGKFLGECTKLAFAFSFAKPVVRERYDLTWAVGPDERVYVNGDLKYGFTVHGGDCRVERKIARDYEPVERSAAELDSIRAFYQRVGNMGDAKLELFENTRDVVWMSVDDLGRLWVLPSRGRLDLPADSLGFFDVYDAQGQLDRTMDLKGERGDRDGYYLDRDRFYVIHSDAPSLIAYRMPGLGR